MRDAGPVDRVRARFARIAGASTAEGLPDGYQRLGGAVLLRLPPTFEPWHSTLGRLYLEELDARCVYRVAGPISGERRHPQLEVLAGIPGTVEVRENGVRYRLEPREIMFASGNRTERRRAGLLPRRGETVVDLFAGIGYFTLPAAVHGGAGHVYACEENPTAFGYLTENIALNGVERQVVALLGDNRRVELPRRVADRVFLGLLPSSLPFVDHAISLLKPSGGWLHVHSVTDTRKALPEAVELVHRIVTTTGAKGGESHVREVKPYGPGRRHVVVDLFVEPTR